MSLVCLLSALHGLRTALIAPDVIRFSEDIKIELSAEAGYRLECYLNHNATLSMMSCLPNLFKHGEGKRWVTIEGVTFIWPGYA